MWLALLMLGCGSGEKEPIAAPVKTPAPAEVAPPPPSPPIDGKNYDGKWLIILSSSKEAGVVPTGTEDLPDVVRLQSSQFKGLMPCYEIVVAGAFAKRKAALARSQELTEQGIDNYAKPAGEYIGDDSRLEAYCNGETTSACDADFRFVEGDYMDLALDAVAAERATAQAPPEKREGESDFWKADLSVEKVEDWSIGQELDGYGLDGTKQACKITGFTTITRGTPHFGWYQGEQSAPGCGSSQVFAKLDCAGPVRFAAPAGGQAVTGFAPDGTKPGSQSVGAAKELLKRDTAYQIAYSRASQQAAEAGEDLAEEISIQQFSSKKAVYLVATSHLTTGEGDDWCGADDLNITISGVVTAPAEGRPAELIVRFREMEGAEVTGLLDFGADGRLEVVEQSWPQRTTVQTAKGKEICAIEIDYCDCPC